MMKIGIIVEGHSEYKSLAELYPRINTPHELMRPLRVPTHPEAAIPEIVRDVESTVKILKEDRINLIIVLLDRETREECLGQFSSQLATALSKRYSVRGQPRFAVVIKNACYENWLIADLAVFSKWLTRFKISNTVRRTIEPNKADHVDGQAILRAAARAQGAYYDKVDDAIKIMQRADPLNIAANSRSFRRFLRVIEHPLYLEQSRSPASPMDNP